MVPLHPTNWYSQRSLTTKFTYGLVTLLLALCTPRVEAALVTYTYTGNNYTSAVNPYSTSMAITGSFTFASPLAPNTVFIGTDLPSTWSISDGVETITNSTGTLAFDAITNSVGGITAWAFATSFNISTGVLLIESVNDPSALLVVASLPCGTSNVCDAVWGVGAGHLVGVAGVGDAPGTWTPTSTVTPEPSLVFPLAIGLFAMAWIARRRTALSIRPATRVESAG